jgi:uncharacterized protein YdaU (DUF1376 family)
MSRNWMPIYWGDYLRDTRHFNTEQHGAYLLLIAHYWQNGSLPTDEGQLAIIAGLTVARWRKLSPPVAAKFSPDWTHGRIDKEIAKADHKIVLRQIAGQKGGLKSGITKAIARANAIPNAVANGIAKTKQSRTNHKERDITSSEQDAPREASVPTITVQSADLPQGRRCENGARPVHEATRADIEASFAKRKHQSA